MPAQLIPVEKQILKVGQVPQLGRDLPAQPILDETQSRDAAVLVRFDPVPFREGLVAQPVRVVRPVHPAGRVVERHQRRPVRRDVDGHVDAGRAAVAVGDRNRYRIAGLRLVVERGAGLELAAGRDDAEVGGVRPGQGVGQRVAHVRIRRRDGSADVLARCRVLGDASRGAGSLGEDRREVGLVHIRDVDGHVDAVLHIRTTSWSSNQPTLDIWLATLSASFVYTITARPR